MGALAVGNGICVGCGRDRVAELSGVQRKSMSIGIFSDWGWHSFPKPNGYRLGRFQFATVKKHDREFVYPNASTSNPPPDAGYLRAIRIVSGWAGSGWK